MIEGRRAEVVKWRDNLQGAHEIAEWRVGAVRVRSSAGVRDKRKTRGVVTVVMRLVAASLEANLAGDQVRE